MTFDKIHTAIEISYEEFTFNRSDSTVFPFLDTNGYPWIPYLLMYLIFVPLAFKLYKKKMFKDPTVDKNKNMSLEEKINLSLKS